MDNIVDELGSALDLFDEEAFMVRQLWAMDDLAQRIEEPPFEDGGLWRAFLARTFTFSDARSLAHRRVLPTAEQQQETLRLDHELKRVDIEAKRIDNATKSSHRAERMRLDWEVRELDAEVKRLDAEAKRLDNLKKRRDLKAPDIDTATKCADRQADS